MKAPQSFFAFFATAKRKNSHDLVFSKHHVENWLVKERWRIFPVVKIAMIVILETFPRSNIGQNFFEIINVLFRNQDIAIRTVEEGWCFDVCEFVKRWLWRIVHATVVFVIIKLSKLARLYQLEEMIELLSTSRIWQVRKQDCQNFGIHFKSFFVDATNGIINHFTDEDSCWVFFAQSLERIYYHFLIFRIHE